ARTRKEHSIFTFRGRKMCDNSNGAAAAADEWTIRLKGKASACHLAKFEPSSMLRKDGKRVEVAAPPLDKSEFCKRPIYMYTETEPDELSEDEEGAAALARRQSEPFDRSAFRRGRRRNRNASDHWVIEDARDFIRETGVRYVGDLVASVPSKYVLLEADPDTMTISATPVDEWWNFKRPPRVAAGDMTVKDAEAEMKAASSGKITNRSLAEKMAKVEAAQAAKLPEEPEERAGAFFSRKRV
ncbi:unnamed protein product, partial [Phaeothamnion confervicola]